MKKIIYTAISEEYDTLKEPLIVTKGWEYICYTNNLNIKSDIWRVVYVDLPTAKDVRKLKILTPFEYDLCIWIDGSIEINCNLDIFLESYHSGYFSLMKHPHRDCIYQEAATCISRKKDLTSVIDRQVNYYKRVNYPSNHGMVATGVLVRNSCERVNRFCEAWWNQVQEFSKRDQLSFNYVAYTNPTRYNLMPFDILKTDFILHKHK